MKIKNSIFDRNYRGAYLSGINYAEAIRNTFIMKPDLEDTDTIYGLFLDKSTGYLVEENRFSCRGNRMIQGVSIPMREFGLVVDSSGSLPNEIYKNYFDSLDMAIVAQRQNRHPDDSTGLVIKCNHYFNNNFDEVVTGNYTSGNDGIAEKQGALTEFTSDGAGNLFSPFHTRPALANGKWRLDIDNRVEPLRYFHHIQIVEDSVIRPMPTLIDTARVRRHVIPHFHDSIECCPSRQNTGGGEPSEEELIAQYLNRKGEADSLLFLLYRTVDGGSTQQMNDEVLTASPPDAYDLLQELLDNSPYLTDTVMKSAIEMETVLPNEMIRDVLVANPQASQSEEVLATLEERFNPMPAFMLEEIMANYDSVSPKLVIEAQVQEAWLEQQKSYNDLVRHYVQDTISSSAQNDLIGLLQTGISLEQRYRLAYTYFYLGLTDEMNAEIAQIPQKFDLDETGIAQYENIVSFFGILNGIADEGRTVFSLTSGEEAQLRTLHGLSSEPVLSWSGILLEMNGLSYYHETVLIPDQLKSTNLTPEIKGKKRIMKEARNILQVFPNPANQFIIVRYIPKGNWKGSGAVRLTISAMHTGRLITERMQQELYTEALFDTRNYPNGAYIVQLTLKGDVIASAIFLVNH